MGMPGLRALSMLLTPALLILYDRVIAPRFIGQDDREMDHIKEISAIIIAGRCRVGEIVSRVLRADGLSPTVMDFSSWQLEMLKAFDVQAYYSDATRPDLLNPAGIADAKLLVIAIDDKDQITELARYVHPNRPDLHIIARAVDRSHVYDLWYAGCRDIIRETYDSSLRIGRSATKALGHTRDQADRMVDVFNEMDRERMLITAEFHDPVVPLHENEEYLAKFRGLRDNWEADLASRSTAIISEPKA